MVHSAMTLRYGHLRIKHAGIGMHDFLTQDLEPPPTGPSAALVGSLRRYSTTGLLGPRLASGSRSGFGHFFLAPAL